MILSKVMKEADYPLLAEEGQVLLDVHNAIQLWNPQQHQARVWEYTMALKALKIAFGDKKGLLVSDHGCGSGFLSPMLYWLGHCVRMYECWSFGQNEEVFMLEQMQRVAWHTPGNKGWYQMWNRPLGSLVEEDKGVDAAFCISTLEHIRNYQEAFRDLLGTVAPGGLVFLTTDFCEHEKDDYNCAHVRAGKMFTKDTYFELYDIAQSMGFELAEDEDAPVEKSPGKTSVLVSDWEWTEDCRLVMGYGFASMALRYENVPDSAGSA